MELGVHIEALRRDPTSGEAAEAIRVGARETGAFRAYAEAFAERGESLLARGENGAAVEAWIEAALVCEENVGDLPRAAQLYERALELDPTHRRALFALGLVLHDLQRWEALIALYRRRIELSSDEGERTTLLQYVAELLAEKKDDRHGAFEALLAAAARAPRNVRNLSRLERLGEATGRLPEVAIAIGDVLMHQEDPHLRAALSLRLAELYLGPLDAPERALAHLRSALADDGANPEVLGEIEDVFREQERFDELAAFLEEVMEDRRIRPHRVRLERELARIYELELDDTPRALEALTRALDIVPDDRELLDEVMRLGLTGGDLSKVAEIYERVASKTKNRLLSTYLRLKLGHIHASVLERPEDARRAYLAILETEPGHAEARRRLERLGEAPSTERRPASEPEPERDPSGVGAPVPRDEDETVWGGAPVVSLNDEGVSDAVDEALALVAEVERIRAEGQRPRPPTEEAIPWPAAPTTTETATAEPAPHAAPPPARRVAVADALAEVLPIADARIASERLRARPPPPPSDEREPARPIRFDARPSVEPPERLEARIDDLEGPERAEMRLRAAASWASLGDDARAEALLRDGLRERARDGRLLLSLAELLEAGGRWADWIEVAERMHDSGAGPSGLALRMAEVAETELEDADLAWRWAHTAARSAPDDEAPRRVLERLARAADDREALAELLDARAVRRRGDSEAALAAARAWAEVEEDARALAVLREAWRAQPGDEEVGRALAEALIEAGASAEAEDVWGELRGRGAPDARARAERAWAELAAGRGALGPAREAAARALELEPESAPGHALASELAARAGDPLAALEHAERAAELEPAPAVAASWQLRAAALAETEVGDTRRAIEALGRALELDPDDPEASARLGRLLRERGEPAAAARHLLGAARALRDEERAAELFEAAGGALEAAEDPGAALAAYEAALERSPRRRRALLRASVLHEAAGALGAAHDRAAHLILHHEADLGVEERAACFVRMARGKEAAKDAPGALRLALRALELESDRGPALACLAWAHEALGAHEKAAEVLRELAPLEPPGPARARRLAHAASLLPGGTASGRARRLALLEEAHAEAPADAAVAEALAAARYDAGDAAGAGRALAAAAELEHGEAAARLWLEAGEATLGDEALDRFRAATRAAPGWAPAVEALDVCLARRGDHAARVAALVEAAAASPERGPAWRARAARLAETVLERPDRALELIEPSEPDRRADGRSERSADRRADLLFRASLLGPEARSEAIRVWSERVFAEPGDRLALARLAELFLADGDPGRARFALELGALVFGVELDPDAPEPAAPSGAAGIPLDPDETGPEAPLLELLGYAPLEALSEERPLPLPRRRDALGPAALGVRVDRPLREAAVALGTAPPPVFSGATADGRVVGPGWGPDGPCLFVDLERAAALEAPSVRYLIGVALAELRPAVLALRLLGPTVLRSVALGLAQQAPSPIDPVPARVARRRARAVERALAPESRARAEVEARSWLENPSRRSLVAALDAAARSAARAGLIASGSPLVAWALAPEDRPLDRARLLRSAFDPRVLTAAPVRSERS